jgi:predicted nucleic acid-binding protein
VDDAPRPLLVLDTNILVDVWLDRGPSVNLLELVEDGAAELVLPEYVLIEFRGKALRWVRDARTKLNQHVRPLAAEWARSRELGEGADAIQVGARTIDERLSRLEETIDTIEQRFRAVARVETHTQEIHFRGDLRYMAGHPPDRPVDGVHDCRIYEAVLDIALADSVTPRPRYVVTRDKDFDHADILRELRELGFEIRSDPGRLYGELRR